MSRAPANAGAVDLRPPLGPPARTRDRRRSVGRRALRHESRRHSRAHTRAGGFPLRVWCARFIGHARYILGGARLLATASLVSRGALRLPARAGSQRSVCRTIDPRWFPHRSRRSSVPLVLPRRARFAFPCILSSSIGSGVPFCLPRSLSSARDTRLRIPLCRGPRHTEAAASRHRAPLLSPAHRRWPKPRPDGGEARARPRAAESWAPTFRLARALHRSPGVA